MKRTVCTLILLAFVLVGAAPCVAANMTCGMKMPSVDERCSACASGDMGGPVLQATSCCRVLPAEDRSAAPAVLSPSTASKTAPVNAVPAVVPAPAADVAGSIVRSAIPLREATGPPPAEARTTVLRL